MYTTYIYIYTHTHFRILINPVLFPPALKRGAAKGVVFKGELAVGSPTSA